MWTQFQLLHVKFHKSEFSMKPNFQYDENLLLKAVNANQISEYSHPCPELYKDEYSTFLFLICWLQFVGLHSPQKFEHFTEHCKDLFTFLQLWIADQ